MTEKQITNCPHPGVKHWEDCCNICTSAFDECGAKYLIPPQKKFFRVLPVLFFCAAAVLSLVFIPIILILRALEPWEN